MSSSKASSVRSQQLLRSANWSWLDLWRATADRLLKVASTPSSKSLMYQAQKAWCTRRKGRQILRRSCDTGMRSAQSGDGVYPPAGARICEANHRRIEAEDCEQCARARRCREERTLIELQSWGLLNNSGLRMVNWKSQSKTPLESGRRTHLLYFHLFVLCSVTCLTTCHYTACFTSLWTSISVSVLMFNVTSARFCLHLLTFITLLRHFHTHMQRHTQLTHNDNQTQKLG